jgi:hypothetical protein
LTLTCRVRPFAISFQRQSLGLKLRKKEIANFDLSNVGEDSFSKFRGFKLWAVENNVYEDTNVIKHLTKLANFSKAIAWSKTP